MRIESKLCHISVDKAVVKVNGWLNEKNVGSALAEGPTVEVAEDKAISRLIKRINSLNSKSINTQTNKENIITNIPKIELPINENNESNKVNQDPTDWSNELTAIDSEIKRLNWSRKDEILFLEQTYGYNNRNKITKYNEVLNYLSKLKSIESPNSTNSNATEIKSLIMESDIILRDLSWDNKKGREYLQREFNVSTRNELNREQLISFVSKLKSIRNQYLP